MVVLLVVTFYFCISTHVINVQKNLELIEEFAWFSVGFLVKK